jgi:hypothetical protein
MSKSWRALLPPAVGRRSVIGLVAVSILAIVAAIRIAEVLHRSSDPAEPAVALRVHVVSPPDGQSVAEAISGPGLVSDVKPKRPPEGNVIGRLEWLLDRLPPQSPSESEDVTRQRELFQGTLEVARRQAGRREVPSGEAEAVARARTVLEGKFSQGTATPDERRFLAALCDMQGNTDCQRFVVGLKE